MGGGQVPGGGAPHSVATGDSGCLWAILGVLISLSGVTVVLGVLIGVVNSSWTVAIWGVALLAVGLLGAAVVDVSDVQGGREMPGRSFPDEGERTVWPLPRHPTSELLLYQAKGSPVDALARAAAALRPDHRLASDEVALLAVPKYPDAMSRRLVVKVTRVPDTGPKPAESAPVGPVLSPAADAPTPAAQPNTPSGAPTTPDPGSAYIAIYSPDDSPRGRMDWLLNASYPLFETTDMLGTLTNRWQLLVPSATLLVWADPAYGRKDLAETIELAVGGNKALWRERRPDILSRLTPSERLVAGFECGYSTGKGLLLLTTDRLVYAPFFPTTEPGFAFSYSEITELDLKGAMGGMYGRLKIVASGRSVELTQFEAQPFGGATMIDEVRRRAGLLGGSAPTTPPWSGPMPDYAARLEAEPSLQAAIREELAAASAAADTGAAGDPTATGATDVGTQSPAGEAQIPPPREAEQDAARETPG